jgi:hypothetical protein
MSPMLRLSIAVLTTAAAVFAQEQAPPASSAQALPSPTPAVAPQAPLPPNVSPAVDQTDTIPLEGAPLDTRDIAPKRPEGAMPDEALTEPEALIPDEGPAVPPAVPPTFESVQEKARQLSIRYREVRVQVEKDPKVLSLLEQAERAKTLEDQRAALREYYRLLFKKIAAIDKSLEQKCKVMETAYLRRLAQERLEPTIPLNPPPTPEPLQ